MIKRYSPREIASVWTEENKFKIWLDVEIAAMEAQAEIGRVPFEALQEVKSRAKFDAARIEEIEKTVKHDVIAFLTNVGEYVGSSARYLHFGMTSSDVLDTSTAIQLKQAGEIILKHLLSLREATRNLARQYKYTVMIGRTHGVHAEPITFGLKAAIWFDELGRDINRLQTAVKDISVAKISGAVGTFSSISPEVEAYVARKFDLSPSVGSTQVIQRDRHAAFMTTLAIIAGTLEKIALEIRHLQRTEVLEVEEPFSKGQKGSSAMPHKRNPVNAERICGLARLIRSYTVSALENQALWHERDISHSSVERIIFPDATIGLDFMVLELEKILNNLNVYPEKMKANLELTRGLYHSEDVLLKLVEKGLSREESYAIVQRNAMICWENKENFLSVLKKDPEINLRIMENELEKLFETSELLTGVDYIFRKLGI
ncbi:MAG: adenylosuccinate lyase [Candidatus Kryptoniota bacterium]